jgi:Nucleotide-diphospho-sugar transferase
MGAFEEPIVCFLLINEIKELPYLSIESCLKNTKSLIYIGYNSENSLRGLPKSERIKFIKLIPDNITENNTYVDFQSLDFFEIVTLKWDLFDRLFHLGYEHIIYSDLDVIWYRDCVEEMKILHSVHKDVKVFIQDATLDPKQPRLCMGFVSFIKSPQVSSLIANCKKNHKLEVSRLQRYGDDEAVTDFYIKEKFPLWIGKLPQIAFPVGIFLNSFSNKPQIPGLKPFFAQPNLSAPYIFHANYLIGERNKLLGIKIMNKYVGVSKNLGFYLYLYLIAKKILFIRHKLKTSFFKSNF